MRGCYSNNLDVYSFDILLLEIVTGKQNGGAYVLRLVRLHCILFSIQFSSAMLSWRKCKIKPDLGALEQGNHHGRHGFVICGIYDG